MDSIEIIQLQPSQWREYKQLRLRTLQEEPQAYSSTYAENLKNPDSLWQEKLEEAQRGETQWFSFAKKGEKLVGMVGAYKDTTDTVHIIAVYVAKEARGQGISKLLMTDLINRIKQNTTIKKLLVDVNVQQEAAVHLYESFGFNIIKKEKMVLGDSKEHECYTMEKLIN